MQGPPRFLDGEFSPDGYAVNTAQPPYQPSGVRAGRRLEIPASPIRRTIPLHAAEPDDRGRHAVGDAACRGRGMPARGSRALADGMQPPSANRSVIYTRVQETINFQPHHHPFNYFVRFAPGTADRERHLKATG